MRYAKLSKHTEHIFFENKMRCAYCGKEIKPDVEIDHGEITEYYHCNCEDAQKQLEIDTKKGKLASEYHQKLLDLERAYPKAKYEIRKETVFAKRK